MRSLLRTTRSWMIATAIVGLCLGLAIGVMRVWRERERYIALANVNREMEANARAIERQRRTTAELITSGLDVGLLQLRKIALQEEVSRSFAIAAKAALRAEYHAAIKRRYERAATRPWMSVERDPPPPLC